MSNARPAVWAVVPAAGVGRRFGGSRPKQYQILAGKPVACWTLERLLAVKGISGCVVAIHPEDACWAELHFDDSRLTTVEGGAERADSVRLALESLSQRADPSDWVLVHDIARPCVHAADIDNLIAGLFDHAVGGVLVTPLADTVKRVEAGNIVGTEDRDQLRSALTPQMFRFGLLRDALRDCHVRGFLPTDEASALEALGYSPKVIPGRRDNIKITCAEDLVIAEAILQARGNS